MSIVKFTEIFAVFGLLIPVIFRSAWYYLNKSGSIKIQIIVEKLMLILWPTSIITLPASYDSNFETKLFIISLLTNCLLYAMIGVLIWLGIRKHISFLAIAGIFLFLLWYWLLTL
jgi:small basic protein